MHLTISLKTVCIFIAFNSPRSADIKGTRQISNDKIENFEYKGSSQKILVNIFQKVKLLAKYPLRVSSKALRQATKAVFGLPVQKATFKLTSKLLPEIFTVSELASSRGQGLRTKKGVDLRPVLDQHRVQIQKGIPNVFSAFNPYK